MTRTPDIVNSNKDNDLAVSIDAVTSNASIKASIAAKPATTNVKAAIAGIAEVATGPIRLITTKDADNVTNNKDNAVAEANAELGFIFESNINTAVKAVTTPTNGNIFFNKPLEFPNNFVEATNIPNAVITPVKPNAAALNLCGSIKDNPITAAINNVIATVIATSPFILSPANADTAIRPPNIISKTDTIAVALTNPAVSILLSMNKTPVNIKSEPDIINNIDPAFMAFFPAKRETAINAANNSPNTITTGILFAISYKLRVAANFRTPTVIPKATDINSIIIPAFVACSPAK